MPLTLAYADDTFTVVPQQAVSIGEGDGDTFAVEQILRNDNSVVVLLRPKGEDCTFRFKVSVGRSVQLRTDTPAGQSFLCKATLRPIIDDGSVQFGADCTAQSRSDERKCPPQSNSAAAASKP